MKKVEFTFECGHTSEATGKEEGKPVCPRCGAALMRVSAPKPTILISSIPYAKKFEE